MDAALSGDERYDLLLAVCEAASNAIEHARDPSEPFIDVLSEISDGRVTVVVRDHGQWSSAASGPHRGRGLQMMWLLADTTLAPSPRGTTVTIRSSPRRRSPVARHDEPERRDGAPFRPPPWAAYDRLGAVAAPGRDERHGTWQGGEHDIQSRGGDPLRHPGRRPRRAGTARTVWWPMCARTLPVSGVGLALMTDDGPAGTVAVSDGGALQLEELQFTLGHGPCVDASRTGSPGPGARPGRYLAPDLAGVRRRRRRGRGSGRSSPSRCGSAPSDSGCSTSTGTSPASCPGRSWPTR